jgi:hypothetical protein
MRNLLRLSGPARSVAAYVATLLFVALLLHLALSGFAALYGGWPYLGVALVWALIIFVSLAATAPVVLILTLALRFTSLPRPGADIGIWMLAFVGLWLVGWWPTLNAFLDGFPLTGSSLLISGLFGGLAGWVYWLCAGRPTPASRG